MHVMPFPWILQRYIFREMGKTFLLAAVALTAVLGLGGGLLKMVRFGEMTPGQLIRLMALMLPVAAALTLPIAALFSAAAAYGRLSADNEFVACRSSGINMHVLFLPTVVLSLFSAAVTFGFINFLIPGMVRNLNEFIATDVGALLQQRLNRPRGITLGGRYRIHADDSTVDASGSNQVVLRRVAFVEVDEDEWVRFGTAREVNLNFERDEQRIRFSGRMSGLSFYDRRAARFADLEEQTVPPNELPTLVPQEIKFLNLWQLLHYWRHPNEWREARDEMTRLRLVVCRRLVYDALVDRWTTSGGLALADDQAELTIDTSRDLLRIPRDGGIEISSPVIEEHKRGRVRQITADRAILEVVRAGSLEETGIEVVAYDAHITSEGVAIEKAKEVLGPVSIPPELIREVTQMSDAQLMSTPGSLAGSDPVTGQRGRARDARDEAARRITATISERFAFSVSVFVLVILGAALGIVFRGAHVVAAFGISFLPSLLVIILIVMGKQMAHNAPTHILGLFVMWGGIVLVTGLDAWILTRVLRR